jgi:hypothetical protein
MAHLIGMHACDEVHVFWDVESSGSHFDLGMALALDKDIVLIRCFNDDEGKSYWKAMQEHVQLGATSE